MSSDNSDWNTWRVWVKDGIRNARMDIDDLYQFTHDMETRCLQDKHAILSEVGTSIGKIRKETNSVIQGFKEEVNKELNDITLNVRILQVRLACWVGGITFFGTLLGTLLIYYIRWKFWSIPPGAP
jgi:hypothetical protein